MHGRKVVAVDDVIFMLHDNVDVFKIRAASRIAGTTTLFSPLRPNALAGTCSSRLVGEVRYDAGPGAVLLVNQNYVVPEPGDRRIRCAFAA